MNILLTVFPKPCLKTGSSVHMIQSCYFRPSSCIYLAIFCLTIWHCRGGLKHWMRRQVGERQTLNRSEDELIQSSVLMGIQFSSVQFSRSVVSDSLRPCESQHARPPCPSPTPGIYSNSCPSSQWCHPAISSSVIPFSSCLQSLPASGSFLMSQLFAWGGQSTGVGCHCLLSTSGHIPRQNYD